MSNALLSVEHLSIAYPRSQQWVIDDVSFKVKAGERIGLVGESGCGKSTLGRAILKMLPEGSRLDGKIDLDGQSVPGLTAAQVRQFRGEAVSLIFQDPMTRLNPLLTIGEHCVETLLAHEPSLSKTAAKQRSLEALAAVNIPVNRWKQYPHEFSGGMRQRVAIALALLLNPKLIVADEPTTSLDVTVSAQILDELTRLCTERQMALILISHDLAVVGQYCDRIAVMYNGKLVELGHTDQVFRSPQHSYTKTLLQSALYLEAGKDQPAAAPTSSEDASAAPLLRLTDLKQHYSLESTFLSNLFTAKADRTIARWMASVLKFTPVKPWAWSGNLAVANPPSLAQYCS